MLLLLLLLLAVPMPMLMLMLEVKTMVAQRLHTCTPAMHIPRFELLLLQFCSPEQMEMGLNQQQQQHQ